MRPLTLHASALNDFEYGLYTSSLNDLCVTSDSDPTVVHDDAHYETMTVGVREARAWLRGRYQDLPASDIDDILRLFFSTLLPTDTLTGGQFFAAHRLVIHAQSGKGIDRSLAFVQALPEDFKAAVVPRPPSPPKRLVKAPPSHPDRSKGPTCNVSHPETNPFARRSMECTTSMPQNPCADSNGSVTMPPRHSGQKISHNPFLMHDKREASDPPDKGAEKNILAKSGKLPPLPPRKPTIPPFVPSKPSHITSPLMQQSLAASKHGKTMKRAEEQLERERVLQVLKSTSSRSSRARSLSPSKTGSEAPGDGAAPAPPRRRQPSSVTSSASSSLPSLDRVASASLKPSHTSSPSVPPPLPSREHATAPGSIPAPPMHPDRRPSTDTNDSQQPSPISSRVFRSRSMHYADASPLPPPRRKRPESVQLPTTSTVTDIPSLPPLVPSPSPSQSHSRNASLSRRLSHTRNWEDSSPMTNIQKTISNLQLKAQPKIDAVRYKAEAGISRRGYVNHSHIGASTRWRDEGEEGLMEDTRWTTNVDQDFHSEPVTDDEPIPHDHDNRLNRGRSHRGFPAESDDLKWPDRIKARWKKGNVLCIIGPIDKLLYMYSRNNGLL
ncbi:hypothetical protein V8B97DRAFT_1974046 [Scleroderma yunnanense]